ncbi:MAG TPA: hypothetical protein DEQ03_06860 [Marinilabiliales bacterium]|nr:hypothetical protein [Marinilabiliales bacterium]
MKFLQYFIFHSILLFVFTSPASYQTFGESTPTTTPPPPSVESMTGDLTQNRQKFFEILESTVTPDLETTLNYALDLTKCEHKSPASIAKQENGKIFDEAAATVNQQIIDYFKKQIEKLKMVTEKASKENALVNQNALHQAGIEIYDKVLKGLNLAKKYNETAIQQYKDAFASSAKEADHDLKLFNECGASLIVDSLNAMEHVRYFYPRQASDGSAKTFEDEQTFKNVENALEELIKAETLQDAGTAFYKAQPIVANMGLASTLDSQKALDLIGYKIDARLRAFWACGMGSSIAYNYLAWARKSQKIGNNSKEQLRNKNSIIKAAMELRKQSCGAVEDKKFHPALTASKVCKAWEQDTLYFSESCESLKKDKENKGINFLDKVLLKANEAIREKNEKVEMTSKGRLLVIEQAKTHAETRLDHLKKTIESFEKTRTHREDEEKALTKITAAENQPVFIFNQIKNFAFLIIIKTNWFISSAYAKAEELFLTSYISSDKKARPCYSPAPSGYCYSLVSQVDAWIFPSSATTESNHLDYLSAQLSDELQGQRFITQKAHKLMEEINAQEKLIDQRYQMAKQNLAKQHPQGMAYLESVHKSYQEGYKQLAYHKFKASGLLTPEARIKIDPNFKMDTPLPTYKSYNPDQEKFTTKLPNHTNEQSTSSPYQEPRQPAGYLDQARENYSSEETPNYKLKELTIHGDEDNSLFEIISSRYLKKYTDF